MIGNGKKTGNIAERRGAAIAQGGISLARSFPIGPPVSNVTSFSSFELMSVTGLLQRVAIDELMRKAFIPCLAISTDTTQPVKVTFPARIMGVVVDDVL